MSTSKPRITVTLEPRTHEVLSRLSAAGDQSMSSIVAQFVEVALPSLERVVVVLERAKAAPQETLDGVASAYERAGRDLIKRLQAGIGQGDMFLGDLAAAIPDAPDAGAGAPARGGSVPKSVRRGVPTPVPVTRGSGAPKRVRRVGSSGPV
jgi:hypothetical protein